MSASISLSQPGTSRRPDRIGREAEPFERVGAEEDGRAGLGEDHERDRGAVIDTDPRVPNVPLDLTPVGQDERRADAYRQPESPVSVLAAEKPWGTHYRVKVYVTDSRDQYLSTTDVTVRGKALLLAAGVKAAQGPAVATVG